MLCPSCRRQLERGAELLRQLRRAARGARRAARARARATRTRVPLVARDDDRPRAGLDARARRPGGLARARAHLRQRRRALLEDAGSSHGTCARRRARHRAGAAARRREDPARRRRSCAVERRRDAAEAGRTIVVRPGASLVVPAVGPPGVTARRRSSGCARACARATRSSGWTPPRAAAAGCSRTSTRGTFLRLSDNDARLFELLDGTRSLVDLIGDRRAALRRDRAGAAGAAAGRPRRARLPRGRRRGGAPAAEAPQGLLAAAVQAAREDRSPGVGARFERALPARRLGAVHAPGADRARRAGRRRASASFVYLIVGRYGTPFVVAQQDRARRPRVPARALRGRGRARDRARADDGVVRAPRRARRASS